MVMIPIGRVRRRDTGTDTGTGTRVLVHLEVRMAVCDGDASGRDAHQR